MCSAKPASDPRCLSVVWRVREPIVFPVLSSELPRALCEGHAALKLAALLALKTRGNNEEGWNRGRYGAYHDLETWRRYVTAAGFVELTHYYRPAGLPRDQQPWLATVWRKTPAT